MLKKNLFHKKFIKIVISITKRIESSFNPFRDKKFTKIPISITKRIESFFNLFKDKNFVKNIYSKIQKTKLDKKIFIFLATILISVIVYFLLPSFYDKNKVRVQLQNQILQQYNFKIILDKNLRYGVFPKPHFLSKNTKIEHDSKIIANSKNTKIFISSKNFLLFNNIKIKNLIFVETDFKINKLNYSYFFNLLNNGTSNQNIDFIKSKFFYLDQNQDVIFLTEMKKLRYLYQNKFLNRVNSKFEIFNLPVKLSAEHDMLENKIFKKISFNSLRLNIQNDLHYIDNEFKGQLHLNLINKNKTINYNLKNKNLYFSTDDNKLTGEINIKPFFLLSNLRINEIEIKKFFKNDSILVNLLKSEIFNNTNFSGKISIEANNLKDLKNVNAIKFDILFQEGVIRVANIKFTFKNFVVFNINDIDVIVVNNKLKFIGDAKLNFINIDNFYSHFQIKKSYRTDIDKISSNFIFNFDDDFIELDELKIEGIEKKIIEEFLYNFNRDRKNIFNKIVLRNTVKEFFKKISLD